MLNAQKRHQHPYTWAEWDQRSCAGKGANCPILIIGTLNGNRIRLSTARFLPPEKARDMEAARDLAILWERAGSTVRPEEYTPIRMPTAAIPEPTLPTVEMAVDAYLSDARARGNSASAVYKKEGIFSRRFKVNPQKGRTEDSGEYIEPAFVLRGQGNQVSSGVGLGDALGMEGNMERELVGAV